MLSHSFVALSHTVSHCFSVFHIVSRYVDMFHCREKIVKHRWVELWWDLKHGAHQEADQRALGNFGNYLLNPPSYPLLYSCFGNPDSPMMDGAAYRAYWGFEVLGLLSRVNIIPWTCHEPEVFIGFHVPNRGIWIPSSIEKWLSCVWFFCGHLWNSWVKHGLLWSWQRDLAIRVL